ncbi:MAG: hypothetical protein WC356_02280 [Candidatus Micrarchaeia archaeon]|jgi:hypothetical protein
MPGQWQDEGGNRILNILFGAQAVDTTLYLGLHMDAVPPLVSVALADLTEPTTGGYARIALTRGVWDINGSQADYAVQTFQASGADFGLIYGSFICTSLTGTTGILLSLDYLYSPIYVVNGKGIQIVPTITV